MCEPLKSGTDAAGPRHFLAERPVHPSTLLEVLTFTGWIAVRYEGTSQDGDTPVFYLALPTTPDKNLDACCMAQLSIPQRALFRWPQDLNEESNEVS